MLMAASFFIRDKEMVLIIRTVLLSLPAITNTTVEISCKDNLIVYFESMVNCGLHVKPYGLAEHGRKHSHWTHSRTVTLPAVLV
jgi:hypothetical protein